MTGGSTSRTSSRRARRSRGRSGTFPNRYACSRSRTTDDIVPELDGAANPATPNVTTVHFDTDTATVGGNHGLSTSYEAGAAETDASSDPSVRAFTESAEGFLDGTDEDTQVFLISREY